MERFENRDEFLHLHIIFKNFEQLLRVHTLFLFQRLKHNLFWLSRLIRDRRIRREFIKVVSAHRCKRSLPTNVVVEFVLQINERVIVL